MNIEKIKKLEIKKIIFSLDENKLKKLELFLKNLKKPDKKRETLKGIWSYKGFEKINNIEKAIHEIRFISIPNLKVIWD